jgi:predicted nucleic acid-binding Zn ribbon protein
MWQKFSEPPADKCEECGGPVTKIISQNTFHLKGTGWYVTDYASGSSGSKPSKAEKKEKKTDENKKKDTSKKETSKDK